MKINFAKQFESITRDFSREFFDETQDALCECASEMCNRFANASPVRTGEFQKSWDYKEYKNVKYIYNSRLSREIPLSNLLEYSSRGHPFIAKTWEINKSDIIELFKQKMNQKLRRK